MVEFAHVIGIGDVGLPELIGEHLDQVPAVVLDATGLAPVNYPFSWDKEKTTVAGESISKLRPTKNFWRLNAYNFKDGKPITDNGWRGRNESSETLNNLPTEKLLRIQLDIADDQNDVKNRKTHNFIVLFHNE
jgi:hypothetical protein